MTLLVRIDGRVVLVVWSEASAGSRGEEYGTSAVGLVRDVTALDAADATVAAATFGANGSIDTNTIQQPVVGFVLTNVGLEAGVSISGAKISEIRL